MGWGFRNRLRTLKADVIRFARGALVVCLAASVLTPCPAAGEPAAALEADIGPQSVAAALTAFARQTGLQVVYVSTITTAQRSQGARAGSTPFEALTQLLAGTGLRFEFINTRTVGIYAGGGT